MSLKQKIMIGAALLATIPMLIASFAISTAATKESRVALEQLSKERLISVRDLTKGRIEDYFGTIQKQILTLSNDRMVIEAMQEFRTSFRSYKNETRADVTTQRRQLTGYYSGGFEGEFGQRNQGQRADAEQWVTQLDEDSVALQHAFIKANPNPLGEKHKLTRLDNRSQYGKNHALYHPSIRHFLEQFEYYDIFLVDPESGDIVYSVFKELDFTTSLKNGQFANTGIGDVFRQANQASAADFVTLSDFSAYPPSYQDPAAFIASPIFDGNRKVGILIFQMPIEHINNLMTHGSNWKEAGLGTSGETYLLGSDSKMRSMSRFLMEDEAGYLEAIQKAGVAEKTVGLIKAKGTSISLHPIKTPGSQASLNGETGFDIFPDYRNVPVLSAYAPVAIEGLNWAIIAEINEAEAFAAATTLSETLLTLSAGIAAVLILIALGMGFWFSGLLSRPILSLTNTIEAIKNNLDLTQRADIHSNDELGQAATAFNTLMEQFHSSIQQANDASSRLASTAEETSAITESTTQIVISQTTETIAVATAIGEMKETVTAVANSAANASLAADEANQQTIAGQQAMESTISQIQTLTTEIDGASHVVRELEQNSNEISAVLDVIQGIAEQTNLLALNAAIEAARAGEQGRGFAVVADEVRTLASRTQDSTEEIKKMIDKLQQGSHRAVTTMEHSREMASESVDKASTTGKILLTIVDAVSKINDMSTQIASASEQQSAVAEEINGNVIQIRSMNEQTATGAKQTSEASSDLARLATDLQVLVEQFRV